MPTSAAERRGQSSSTSAKASDDVNLKDVFLGDSYTQASVDGGGYALVTAAEMGWAPPLIAAIGGTGYVSSGTAGVGATYADRLDAVTAADPDVVVVQGSTNDVGTPAAAVGAAARVLYEQLAERVPDARVVVVGPLAPSGVDPAAVREIRDALADAAQGADLPFIDPIAESWLSPPDGLFADEIHPNEVGYRQFADDLAQALRDEGF